jgi:predicted amidohydrolase YtcJ
MAKHQCDHIVFLLQLALATGELALRVFLTINHSEMETLLAQHPAPSTLPSAHAHPYSGSSLPPLLSCNRVKLYSDGSLGAETAALRRPYVGTDNVGLLIHSADELADKVASAHTAGYQLEVIAVTSHLCIFQTLYGVSAVAS